MVKKLPAAALRTAFSTRNPKHDCSRSPLVCGLRHSEPHRFLVMCHHSRLWSVYPRIWHQLVCQFRGRGDENPPLIRAVTSTSDAAMVSTSLPKRITRIISCVSCFGNLFPAFPHTAMFATSSPRTERSPQAKKSRPGGDRDGFFHQEARQAPTHGCFTGSSRLSE